MTGHGVDVVSGGLLVAPVVLVGDEETRDRPLLVFHQVKVVLMKSLYRSC